MVDRTQNGFKVNWGILLQTVALLATVITLAMAGERRIVIMEQRLVAQQDQIGDLKVMISKMSDQAVIIASNQAVVAAILKEIHDRHSREDSRR